MRCWKRYAGARRQASAPCVAGARGVCASARDARQAGLRRLGRLSTRDCTSAYGRAVSGCAAGMLGGMCSGARSVRATGSASFAMCCGRGRAAAAAVPVRAASLARPLSVGCARATAALAHACRDPQAAGRGAFCRGSLGRACDGGTHCAWCAAARRGRSWSAAGRKSSMSAASAAGADTPSAIPSISRLNRRAACAVRVGWRQSESGRAYSLSAVVPTAGRGTARPREIAKRAMERAVGRSGQGACGLCVCCAWWQGDVDRCGQDEARRPRRHDA